MKIWARIPPDELALALAEYIARHHGREVPTGSRLEIVVGDPQMLNTWSVRIVSPK